MKALNRTIFDITVWHEISVRSTQFLQIPCRSAKINSCENKLLPKKFAKIYSLYLLGMLNFNGCKQSYIRLWFLSLSSIAHEIHKKYSQE